MPLVAFCDESNIDCLICRLLVTWSVCPSSVLNMKLLISWRVFVGKSRTRVSTPIRPSGSVISSPTRTWVTRRGIGVEHTTWRLSKMNLAIRGIDAQIAHGDTFHRRRLSGPQGGLRARQPAFQRQRLAWRTPTRRALCSGRSQGNRCRGAIVAKQPPSRAPNEVEFTALCDACVASAHQSITRGAGSPPS